MSSGTDPVYVVAGFPRTGTSVTVNAVHKGGISAVRELRRPRTRKGYQDQPVDYWQPREGWWRLTDPASAQGAVVKFLLFADGPRLPDMADAFYRMVVLLRDPTEVRRSTRAVNGRSGLYSEHRAVCWAVQHQRRPDVASVVLMEHRALMEDPRRALARLDWPINVDRAATAVLPDWWRHRT